MLVPPTVAGRRVNPARFVDALVVVIGVANRFIAGVVVVAVVAAESSRPPDGGGDDDVSGR